MPVDLGFLAYGLVCALSGALRGLKYQLALIVLLAGCVVAAVLAEPWLGPLVQRSLSTSADAAAAVARVGVLVGLWTLLFFVRFALVTHGFVRDGELIPRDIGGSARVAGSLLGLARAALLLLVVLSAFEPARHLLTRLERRARVSTSDSLVVKVARRVDVYPDIAGLVSAAAPKAPVPPAERQDSKKAQPEKKHAPDPAWVKEVEL